MANAETEQARGAELIPATPPGVDRLKRLPIIDTIDARTLSLIKSQVAPRCNDGEVGHFLELCAHYELDPFAREAWCAKSERGQLLIMIGRDGLRKIVQRNGLHMDCDVVHAMDNFAIVRTPDGDRTVEHSYGTPEQRGDIVGAWAEVRKGGPGGKPMGFFYAPLAEYMPEKPLSYSPWSKQTSVMILAAAERQAARQATPLGGLLIEGEDEVVIDHETGNRVGAGTGSGEPLGLVLGPDVEAVLARAAELGHAGLADRASAEMHLGGQSSTKVAQWVLAASAELDAMPPDAEVVDPEPEAAPEAAEAPKAQISRDPDAVERMRAQALELLDFADAMDADGKPDDAERARGKAEGLMSEVEAASDPAQEVLPL